MRLMPGHVYLNECPSDDTVLDSGASFSMISEEFVTACAFGEKPGGLQSHLRHCGRRNGALDKNTYRRDGKSGPMRIHTGSGGGGGPNG